MNDPGSSIIYGTPSLWLLFSAVAQLRHYSPGPQQSPKGFYTFLFRFTKYDNFCLVTGIMSLPLNLFTSNSFLKDNYST